MSSGIERCRFCLKYLAKRPDNISFKPGIPDGINRKTGHFNFFPKKQDIFTFKGKFFLEVSEHSLK
jgi:hypothetical protein